MTAAYPEDGGKEDRDPEGSNLCERATALIERARSTFNEALLMSAVISGGPGGAEECRARIDAMVADDIKQDSVHPALWAQVQQVLEKGGP